jgi:hypothetical protein
MIEVLASVYQLRVIDFDPENIAKSINGIMVECEENTDDALEWCNIALVPSSTLVNGTIDRFLSRNCHTVYYGFTISGAAKLLHLHWLCTRGTILAA